MQVIKDNFFPLKINSLQRSYVATSMAIMGRALEAASQVDTEIRRELAGLCTGYLFEMSVIPAGPGIVLQKQVDGSFKYLGNQASKKPDLKIQIKHLAHAFLLLTFQESTASAFANDRMVVDGDISLAMRIVRCLNRLEVFILPKFIAKRAVKRYPNISLSHKTRHGVRIYSQLAINFAKSAVHA